MGCNDSTRVFFSEASQSVVETAGTAEIKVKLNRSSKIGVGDVNSPNSVTNREIKVPFTISGTAQIGTNHGLTNGIIVFPPDSREAKIRVPIYHNIVFEGDKTLTVTLGNPEGADLGDLTTHTLTIVEADLSPPINFVSASQTVSEGAGTVSIPVALEYASESNAVIPYHFSGTAGQGIDFTSAASMTIPAGQTSGNIQINLIDNFVINADKTIIVDLDAPSGAHLGTSTTHTMTVVDNDNQPTVFLSAATQSVSESAGTVTVQFSMSKTYLIDVTVPYTISGTASNPGDYDLSAGSLTIAPGSTSGSISFNLVSDFLDEPNETVIVTLGTVTNGNTGSPSSQTITINDDDPTPTVQFSSATQSVSEAVGNVTVQVNLSAVSGQNVQVPFTVSGTASYPSDHNLTSGTLTIPAGTSSTTTSFTVNNDTLYENNETVTLTLGTPTNATASGVAVQTITIKNNDPAPTVNFSSSAQSMTEGDSGTTTLNIAVNLSSVSGVSATVPFSVGGTATSITDYSATTSSPLVIPAGSTSGTISISINDDNTYENNETIVATLGTPTNGTLGATSSHTITLNNDDPVPSVSFSASAQTVTEAAGQVYVLFVMTNPSDFPVTIPYTASGTASYPSDHGLQSGSVIITPGNTDKVFTFSVVNDAVPEATETVALTIGSVTNGNLGTPDTHTVSITDNDRKFTLNNTRLWLDADFGVVKDRDQKILSWTPRHSELGIALPNILDAQWSLSSWLRVPMAESRDWDWLWKALEFKMSPSAQDIIYAVTGDAMEIEKIEQSEIESWTRGFQGKLSEVLWLTLDPELNSVQEIESYLETKYSRFNDG
jgi:hypothetical protein